MAARLEKVQSARPNKLDRCAECLDVIRERVLGLIGRRNTTRPGTWTPSIRGPPHMPLHIVCLQWPFETTLSVLVHKAA